LGEALARGDQGRLGSAIGRISTVGSDAAHAHMVLSAQIAQLVSRQALTQAFEDVFYLFAALFVVALVIVPFAKVPPLSNEIPPEAH
jgi:MFS transporter, DHA2 family, multidrug resistance protein